ncbi:sensor histidine kinase [Streptomyces sp. NPDC090025]|uniref:sensor histidine kinase n=1 Tax=Streptomyces sp. NPDC090025 TaxID=3365922 RepID=UPI003832BC2D
MTKRRPGLSARMKLTLSYAGFLAVAGALLLAVVWWFLLRYVPDKDKGLLGISPNRYLLVRTFAPAAALAMGFLLLFGLVGGWWLAGRMLAPLDRITAAARTAATGSLSHRIGLAGRQDEFRELADAFDTMLGRLEAHVAEQRRFAANASHELRTPLAISQTLLDVARKDPTQDRDALLARLQVVNSRAIGLTEALLLLSRSERGGFARGPVDLSLVAEEAAEDLLPLAEERGLTLDVTGTPARTTGSAELLLRLATNLVQNAVVHNLPAGQGGTVTVHTEERGDTAVLRVENTGPQVPAALLPTLTEPFQRASERTRTTPDHAGVGLGLAIAASLTQAHTGTLTMTARPTGGLVATVRLPRLSGLPQLP